MQQRFQTASYFDYAAATPLDARVAAAMAPYASRFFGNPGALHLIGQQASRAVFRARRVIAQTVGANYREIIFTGSATEANNLALRGALRGYRTNTLTPRIIVSAIEHESVLATVRDLEREGAEVKILPVSRDGVVRIEELPRFLNNRTVLVSVMYANNEVGTIQPIAKIAAIIREFKNRKYKIEDRAKSSHPAIQQSSYPVFHTDAVQAFQYLDCDVRELGVDLMTLSAHKIYGPKGIGVLYMRRTLNPSGYTLYPTITGGGQELGLRSGTENVPAIVGFARAVEIAGLMRARETVRVAALRDRFLSGLKRISRIALNGGRKNRLPNNVNIHVLGTKAEELAMALDRRGFAVSPGPACAARTAEPSHVLKAMGCGPARCRESIRITFGRQTTVQSVDRLLRAVIELSAQGKGNT